jgi:uncharacterized protein
MTDIPSDQFTGTGRSQVRRLPDRGRYDKDTVYQIIDEALICHVGFIENDQPFVIPTIHARIDDTLFFHGARASRLLKLAATGQPLCVSMTLVDGLVLARSVFHHSINYRSVVVFGAGRLVESDDEKLAALKAITDHIAPGRWDETRPPNSKELNATNVIILPISEASAKLRAGPAGDDEEDYALPVWAGVLPLELQSQAPIPDARLLPGIKVPEYIRTYRRKQE